MSIKRLSSRAGLKLSKHPPEIMMLVGGTAAVDEETRQDQLQRMLEIQGKIRWKTAEQAQELVHPR